MRLVRVVTIYVLFIALCLGAVYSASSSWSPEALYLNPFLMPLYFLVTTLLFIIIMTEKLLPTMSGKFGVLVLHAFLTRIITVIFFYPGTSGDNTYHLAHARTFAIFGRYYMALAPTPPQEIQSLIGRLFVFQRGSIQYGLVTALSKSLFIDVFWIHLFIVGALWSLFVPVIGFKIGKTLGSDDRVALLTALLVANAPIIVGWSASSVPNSLGFFFFFVTLYFLLRWLASQKSRKYFLLMLLATVVSLLTHALTGLGSVILVMLASVVRIHHSWRNTHRTAASLFLAFGLLACVMLIPAASVLMYLVYPTYSSFSLQKILSYDVYHIVLANFADYTTIQTLLYGSMTLLAIIGMVIHSQQSKKKNLNLFMILAFVFIIAEYRINLYFSTRPLFGLERILTFEPFIVAPFAAMTIDYFIRTASPHSPAVSNPEPSKLSSILRFKLPMKEIVVVLLVCLGSSALIVEGALANFKGLGFRREPYGINSVYSTEAARLIHEEYLETQEKYAVVCDPVSEGAGMAVVGRNNPNEFYLYRYDNNELYVNLLRDLSTESLLNASLYNDAALVYVIVSKWSVARYLGPRVDYYQIMDTLSRLLEVFTIVGKGDRQVHVFRFRAEYRTGTGPSVTVYKDTEQDKLNTTYSFINLQSVTYKLNVTGAINYSITGWPTHWSYEGIAPATNASIDSNRWINFTGAPEVTYTIVWMANEYYDIVIWKDDSFLEGWHVNARGGVSNYTFRSDGDIAAEHLDPPLNPRDWVKAEKELPALQNCTTLLVRLKGDANSRFSVLLWEGTEIVLSSGHLTPSTDFKVYTFILPYDAILTRIWISTITNDGESTTIDWDYVMLAQD